MNSEKFVRDGIVLTGIQQVVLALLFILTTAGVIRFGFPASQPQNGVEGFLPIIAVALGVMFSAAYLAVAAGLFGRREWARIGGMALSLIGVGAGLFVLYFAVSASIRALEPDWSSILAIAGAASAAYLLLSVFDLAALLFLVSPRTRAAFHREEYPVPVPDSLSPMELMASRFLNGNRTPPSE